MCRYQDFTEVVTKLTEKSRPSSFLQQSTHRMPGQKLMVETSTSTAPGMRDFLRPVMHPGSVSLTSIATALYLWQGTRTPGRLLAYLRSWKIVRLCIQYISALLLWLTSFLPMEKNQGSICQEQKSPKRYSCGELVPHMLVLQEWLQVCPKQCTYQKLKFNQ